MHSSPASVSFAVLSFEGPDRYSLAGGLGVRVDQLSLALAARGHDTHLFFVGDPGLPARETPGEDRLTWHRWCQWVSAHHPGGVYAGEDDKVGDFRESLPPVLLDQFVKPALDAGRLPVVLAEEWHTVDAVVRLHDLLVSEGIRDRVVILWNANNTMSFHRIDWPRLKGAARVTTVSRYMKHLMWSRDVNPLVIPNGIPEELLRPVNEAGVREMREVFGVDDETLLLFKVGRFDPAKRWLMAVDAAALLKGAGWRVAFVFSGGIEEHGQEVLARARDRALSVAHVNGEAPSWEPFAERLRGRPRHDLTSLHCYLPADVMRILYAAADGVLANSGHEPFGLVGLEAMAAGGIVFTGATGEDYAVGGESAIVLDTDQPEEIVGEVLALKGDPDRAAALRRAARTRAADFTWSKAVDVLLDKVRFVGRTERHEIRPPDSARERVGGVVIYTVVHQPRRLRLPARHLTAGASAEELAAGLFDDEMNERYFRKVATTCYRPAVAKFRQLVREGLKLSIGFSLSFVEQAERWGKDVLDGFRELVRHENVELVAVEPTHGFVLLFDVPRFVESMRRAADGLEAAFGVRPTVADTTELMMSDTIYHALDRAGFRGGFLDGRPWVLQGRPATRLYDHGGGDLRLLVRHHQLSDDVGYRFSNRGWSCWPLTAGEYASWLAGCPGDAVVLGWDFETFGEHHREESGIFAFLDHLPREVMRAGLEFLTPTECLDRYGRKREELPLPAFASTWAGSGGLEFFLGNDAQRAVFQLMMQAYGKARLTERDEFVDLALWLCQSDNLHLIQWFRQHGSAAEVSAYFTPDEWWRLGPDGIVGEIQQVYENFIEALDPHVRRATEAAARPVRVGRRVEA